MPYLCSRKGNNNAKIWHILILTTIVKVARTSIIMNMNITMSTNLMNIIIMSIR